ncbi:MAG: RluA family pseudouridine synthase, partial [Clostridia bacterium]|nr:RluA family pseudouridine synthase [Clostridia bacterium]
IKRVEISVIKREVSEDGKRAITHFEIIRSGGGYSLAEIFLETGRTHQIRVHFSHIGCPLVGDWLYGDDSADDASGQLLHAYYAEFFHPATGEKMVFSLPLPEDMEKY